MENLKRLKRMCFAGLVAGSAWLWAQEETQIIDEEVVVYGSKTETVLAETTTHTLVVTKEEIEAHQWKTIADVLVGLPGVSLVANGGDGKLTTLFLRGAKSENTLVLMNGTKLNDPTNVGKGFDFAHLSTFGIERIEVILGPQNTLYGTDASAGVINIVTESGNGPFHGQAGIELSDEETQRYQVGLLGGSGNLNYAIHGEHYDSDSLSARTDQPLPQLELETDTYTSTSVIAELGYRFDEDLDLSVNLTSTKGDNDIDTFDGDDPNYRSEYVQSTLSAQLSGSFFGEDWHQVVALSYMDVARELTDEVDEAHPDSSSVSDFDGNIASLEVRNRYQASEAVALFLGVMHEREQADGASLFNSSFGTSETVFDESTDTNSLFAQVQYSAPSGFYGNAGARYDDHSVFDGETTYNLGVGYHFEATGTRLRAAYGTGFKAPSIYQLYVPAYGNANLEAETSTSWEAGFVQNFAEERGEFGLSVFENEYENMVEFVFDSVTFQSSYENLSEAESSGWELWLGYQVARWQVRLGYEDLEADDTSSEEDIPLVRRHDDKAHLRVSVAATANLRLSADVLRYGEAIDRVFGVGDLALDAYTLVNLNLGYQFGEQWAVHLRADNLFDEEYTRILNYGTNGRRIFAGANLRF